MVKKEKERKVMLGGMEGVKLRLLRIREKEKKQEKELYEREHPRLTKFKKGVEKAEKRVEKKISRALKKRIVSRRILKPNKMTITIKKVEQEPYRPIYFKETFEQEKRSMFFD